MRSNEELAEYLRRKGFSEKIVEAFRRVDRKEFVVPEHSKYAYEDTALPLFLGQTISQPSVIAEMLEMADLEKGHKVLEIGTGSGYTAALIHEITKAPVYSVDILPQLIEYARERLRGREVFLFARDGSEGLPEHAPFDRIIIHAAVSRIPPLEGQLKPKGIIVAPVGSEHYQVLEKHVLGEHGLFCAKRGTPVVFVPMRGKHGFK